MKEPKKIRGVYEHPAGSNVHWIQYYDCEGRRRREKVGTRAAAEKLVQMRRVARIEGRKLPPPRTRPLFFRELTEAAEKYTEGRAGHKAVVSRMKNLKAEFGNQVADTIEPDQIETWLASRNDWTIATRNRHLALLKLVYRLAEAKRRITRNPARLVRQKKENNARIVWLNDAEEKSLREVILRDCPGHLPEFDIALHTGMRMSEQYGATWENIDFENGLLRIEKSKHGEGRYVRLNSRVRMILAALKEKSLGTGPIFSAPGPRSWFEPAVEAAKLKQHFTWHCLRHTFISRLVMAGIPLKTVQELAGHKTIAMTCRYAHLSAEHEQAAIEKLVAVPTAISTATAPKTEEKQNAVRVQ